MRRFVSIHFSFLTVFIVRSQTFNIVVNHTIPDDNTTVAFDLSVKGLPLIIRTDCQIN
jgi:hypothetical protein